MVITLDNGQTAVIYERQEIIPQLKDYIDREIYSLLIGTLNNDLDMEIVELQDELDESEKECESLENEINDLENKKDRILSSIRDIFEKSRDNQLSIDEIENKLEEIYMNN